MCLRQRYYYDEKLKKMVKAEEYERPVRMQIILDIDQQGNSYESPTNPGKWITSRAQRREDIIMSGCREVDPTESRKFFNNERKWNVKI